jgi:hypothetical protein
MALAQGWGALLAEEFALLEVLLDRFAAIRLELLPLPLVPMEFIAV